MGSVIVSGARTPIGKLLGSLSSLEVVELGAHAISAAVERSGLEYGDVDTVLMGTVVQAGAGPNPARLAAHRAGIPLSAPATTVNKLCLSGIAAIIHADLLVRAGLATAVVAGGMESMSNAPHLTHVRRGVRYGATTLADALDRDALVCGIEAEVMGAATERHQRDSAMSRGDQDAYAARSHSRATAAIESGFFDAEIAPLSVSQRGGSVVVDRDEGVRPGTTAEALAALRPAFAPDGTITAGSASQLSDGAAAVVVMDKDEAERRGLAWIAEIVSSGSVAGPDTSLLHQPARAIELAGRRADLDPRSLDRVEINEAFASVALASIRDLELDEERVNVHGGAIALGHPVGMSGARLVLTLAHALREAGGGLGAAALCGGGGQGDALIIRV